MERGRTSRTLGAALVGAALGGVVAWGAAVEPRRVQYRVERVRVPGARGRATMVHVSDLHAHRPLALHERIAARIREAAPDLLVLTGDSVDRRDGLEPFRRFLDLLPPEVPTFAVMGNWEYEAGILPDEIEHLLAARNGTLLVNRSLRLRTPAGPLRITGLDDLVRGTPDWAGALSEVEDDASPHLVLAHCPAQRDRIPRDVAALERARAALGRPAPARPWLVLSGHTHGGQVRVPGLTWTPRGSGRYLRGWYREAGLPDLFVSRGVGSAVPIRLGSPPEVAIFALEGDA